ncbi:hypothetical protein D3C76_1171700 [compost metagenome]
MICAFGSCSCNQLRCGISSALSSMRSVLFNATISGPVTYWTRSRTIWSSSVHLVRSTTKITTSTSFNAAEAVLFM